MVNGEYDKGKDKANNACNKNANSMDCTVEATAQAMKDEFGCDKECVTKELNDFYKNLCKDVGLVLKDRNGKVIEKDSDTEGGK